MYPSPWKDVSYFKLCTEVLEKPHINLGFEDIQNNSYPSLEWQLACYLSVCRLRGCKHKSSHLHVALAVCRF